MPFTIICEDLIELKLLEKVPLPFLSSHFIRMSKLSRAVLTSIVFISALSFWLIGSIIVINIDSEDLLKFRRLTEIEKGSRDRVDEYCRILGKNNLQIDAKKESTNRIVRGDVGTKESEEILDKARREKLIRDNLIYFPEFKQMWCLVPKAASTSWSKAIIDRLNSEHLKLFVDPKSNISLQVILRQNYGNINKKIYTDAIRSDEVKKVLLVRHPFSRVVSAYEDKLLDRKSRPDGMFFFQRYGVNMNRNFRTNRRLNKKKEPTFDEFVQYLINTNTMDYDEHWKPIFSMCGLCQIRYDHIIFVEDLKNTADFHLQSLGFPKGYKFPMENARKGTSFNEPFKHISNSKKIKLLTKYQEDFRLFGYSFLKHYI